MKKLMLYAPRPIKRQSFVGVKKHVVPNQSLTLKEVVKRFVRREQLPVEKQGIYVDNGYDMEKILHMDMVDQGEVLEQVKSDVKRRGEEIEKKRAKGKTGPPPNPPTPPDPPTPPPAV